MLSYQHIYHAGNLADVQKHALLAVMLDYLTRKDKPLCYLETHAGRGLYDLSSEEAVKTGEAKAGIAAVGDWFAPDHPYRKALDQVQSLYGTQAYAGSPILAETLLRKIDKMHLAELHPQEGERTGPSPACDPCGRGRRRCTPQMSQGRVLARRSTGSARPGAARYLAKSLCARAERGANPRGAARW